MRQAGPVLAPANRQQAWRRFVKRLGRASKCGAVLRALLLKGAARLPPVPACWQPSNIAWLFGGGAQATANFALLGCFAYLLHFVPTAMQALSYK